MPKTFAERKKEALQLGHSLSEQIKEEVDRSQKKQLMTQLAEVNDTLNELDTQEAFAAKQAEESRRLENAGAGGDGGGEPDRAKSLGEHFVKELGGEEGLHNFKESSAKNAVTSWFEKANTTVVGTRGDQSSVEDSPYAPWLTDVDRQVVRGYRRRTVIADLLGSGQLAGTVAKYFLEGPFEGGFQTVAEGAAKPQVSAGPPSAVTDAVKKIAGWFKVTDEMLEDLPFMVSEINNRGLYELALEEERQLLSGDGQGENLLGIRNRSGVQSLEAAETGARAAAEAVYAAGTQIQLATGMLPDSVIINPLDYEQLLFMQDSNGQYFAGGPFNGQYGNGGVMTHPPIFGLPAVVTPAIEIGSPVVGAFRRAATVYRKGGVRVEATNSHGDDFIHNRVTTRIEERLALAVRRPSAIAELSVDTGAGVGAGDGGTGGEN